MKYAVLFQIVFRQRFTYAFVAHIKVSQIHQQGVHSIWEANPRIEPLQMPRYAHDQSQQQIAVPGERIEVRNRSFPNLSPLAQDHDKATLYK